MFVIIDIESYRHWMGYISAEAQTVEIPQQTQQLLDFDSDNLDALFSDQQLLVDNEFAAASAAPAAAEADSTAEKSFNIDAGTYNLVLLKVADGVEPQEALNRLNSQFKAAGIDVRAVIWHKAIGSIGSMAMLIKTSLFVFVMMLFFVAIVIIVNTLSMAALERSAEIGMMRAIGARKGFIGTMFVGETAVLAAFFGSLGIAAGWVVILVLSALNITTDNDMIQLLYGGDTFSPFLTVADLSLVIIQLSFVVVLAVIYPVLVARNINPLDAVSRE
jgi:ABC-type lipoprotein release transport system permease subunit